MKRIFLVVAAMLALAGTAAAAVPAPPSGLTPQELQRYQATVKTAEDRAKFIATRAFLQGKAGFTKSCDIRFALNEDEEDKLIQELIRRQSETMLA